MTQELVKEIFDYHEEGYLIWKVDRCANKTIGKNACYWDKSCGYFRTRLKGKQYLSHSLIFLWHMGYMPDCVDHKDTDKKNNKIGNLRESNNGQNKANTSKINKITASKHKGLSYDPKKGLWRAVIGYNKKRIGLGRYKSETKAALAYNNAAVRYFGEFANLNIVTN